jgi:hypothetical protein
VGVRSDVVALRLEAFVRDIGVRRQIRARLTSRALEADQEQRRAATATTDDNNDTDDTAAVANEDYEARGERVMGLLGRDRDLEAALALFEAHTASDDHLHRISPSLLALLADPKRTHQGASMLLSLGGSDMRR